VLRGRVHHPKFFIAVSLESLRPVPLSKDQGERSFQSAACRQF
jgi:hypothetical protein